MTENVPPSNPDGISCLLQAIDDNDDDDFVQAPPMKRINIEIGILVLYSLNYLTLII